jgi:hypothetical protein
LFWNADLRSPLPPRGPRQLNSPAVKKGIEERKTKIFCVALGLALALASSVSGEGVSLRKTKIVDLKEKEVKVDLVFNKDTRMLLVRGSEAVVAEIPYDSIDKVSYEFSKHRRVKRGALIRVASLGAGAVVMLTKSKKHWL